MHASRGSHNVLSASLLGLNETCGVVDHWDDFGTSRSAASTDAAVRRDAGRDGGALWHQHALTLGSIETKLTRWPASGREAPLARTGCSGAGGAPMRRLIGLMAAGLLIASTGVVVAADDTIRTVGDEKLRPQRDDPGDLEVPAGHDQGGLRRRSDRPARRSNDRSRTPSPSSIRRTYRRRSMRYSAADACQAALAAHFRGPRGPTRPRRECRRGGPGCARRLIAVLRRPVGVGHGDRSVRDHPRLRVRHPSLDAGGDPGPVTQQDRTLDHHPG